MTMKKTLYSLFLLSALCAWGQAPTISPQVINSMGNYSQVGSSGIYITSNIGEPFVSTLSNNSNILTQGFIQPEVISIGGFSLEPKIANLSCTNKNDGEISLTVTQPAQVSGVTIKYRWSDTTLCPNKDCASLKDLKAGTYSVMVVVSYSNIAGVLKTDTLRNDTMVVEDQKLPCNVKVFTGITLNNDGVNDVFTIDNIEQFPNNHVLIFNRWGKQLADIKSYDNINKFWPEKADADKLPSSTYFYIVDLGDGSKPFKGWVELMKNQ